MFKRLLHLGWLLALALAACSPATAPAPSALPPASTFADPTYTPASLLPRSTRDITNPGCTVVSRRNQPTETSPFPPVTAADWSLGPADATVTLIEYSEFQCPYCALFAPVVAQLKADFADDLRVVFRHFPLPGHDKASLASQAAEAAGLQGQFWAMHDLLFERQSDWSALSVAAFREWLVEAVHELGLDARQFAADMESSAIVAKIAEAQQVALNLGLPGTPTLVINGQFYDGPWDVVNLSTIIKLIKLEDRQYTDCPPIIIDTLKQYRATIKTEKGDIVIDLFPEQAPIAVNNFVFLAREGWYDGVTFHRVLPGFVAQAGDPTGTGFGGPGYAFVNEVVPGLTFDGPGILAMANAGPDSNGSQFFITYAAQPQLNGGYTIFGKVLSGMDVAQNLMPRDPSRQPDAPPGDRILEILVEER